MGRSGRDTTGANVCSPVYGTPLAWAIDHCRSLPIHGIHCYLVPEALPLSHPRTFLFKTTDEEGERWLTCNYATENRKTLEICISVNQKRTLVGQICRSQWKRLFLYYTYNINNVSLYICTCVCARAFNYMRSLMWAHKNSLLNYRSLSLPILSQETVVFDPLPFHSALAIPPASMPTPLVCHRTLEKVCDERPPRGEGVKVCCSQRDRRTSLASFIVDEVRSKGRG